MAILCLPSSSERTEGAAVKRIVQRQDPPLGLVAIGILNAGKGTGELEGAFPGFGAAVAEEGAIEPRHFRELFRELRLKLMEEQVGNVDQAISLTFQRRLNRRMAIAEGIHADAAKKVEIPLAMR